MKSVKRIGSGLMAAILLISLLPVQALAAETACPHHPEHTAECGYAPAVEGAPCTHEHTDDCYVSTTACILEDPSSPDELEAPAEDAHVCSEETDCITKTLNCPHARGEHDETCGYAAPSAGAACGFVCDKCPQEGKADPQGEQPQEPSGETPVCTCTERCEAGAANAQCPVCAADPAACGVTDVQEPQAPTCGGMEGCADGKHNPACPLYVAPTCGNLEGCADDQHNPACPLYVAPTCSNLEGCVDDQHNPACPLYVAPTCSNLEGCVDDKHDPNCPLYVAEEPEELADDGLTGPCGDNATYTLTPNGDATYTLTISGTGEMTDYAKAALAPWHQYRAKITKVEFSEGLTTIGSRTCSSSAITTCRIPSTVRKIGDDAFSSTSNLANVEFAEQSQLEEIGKGAFWSTSSLNINLVFPDSLKKIGPLAFEKSGIARVTFGNSLETIESSAFSVCANLTGEVYLPDSLKSLGNQAFNSSPITSVRIGPNIETWGGNAFLRGKGMPKIPVKNGILVVKEGINKNTVVNSQYAGLDFQTIWVSSGKEMTFKSSSFAHLSDVHTLVFLGDTLPTFESNAFLNTFPKIVYGINDNVSAWSGSSASIAITNGGTFASDTSFEAGKLATPTKAGHVFLGWYENEDFTGAPVTQPVSGKTYYANWRELKPSEIVLSILKDGNPITEATYGDAITLKAVVSQQTTRAAVNTVDFFLSDQKLGTAEVKGGTAEYVLQLEGENWKKGFQIGKNTLTAQYGGSDQLLDGSVTFDLTVNKASQIAPVLRTDFTVDYANEQLSAGDSVEIWTAKDGGKQLTAPVSLTEHLGKTLYARFKETDTHLASGWTDVSIAQRPAAPTGVTGGRATLTGVNDTMEYSLDGKTFIKVPAGAGKVENLTAGIYQVRIAATATAPASSAVQATVYDRTGSLTTTQTNGSVTTETTLRDDGTSTVVTTEKRPDGTVSALLENKDKSGKVTSSQRTITNPDGSKLVIQLPEDGSKVVTQYDKNGKVIQQTTYPDKNKPAYIITGFAPKIVEGNGRSFWGWSLSLRTDDALCNFQDVLVQGLSLNPSNYEVSEKDGTTQIILKRGYLAKLPAGTYKIGIVSTNGTAWGTFVIPAKGEGWNPGTGDYIFFTGATLLLSAAALTLLLLRKKRRQ